MQMRLRTKRLVLCAVFVALGVGLQIVESIIPLPVNLPGGKLGLANIATLILLYSFGAKQRLYALFCVLSWVVCSMAA